ncbi:hypothetical protein B7463_g3428, partial [Scytalidium lignicola]
MADPFSIVGVIGVAIQIMQVAVDFGLDWKDAPDDAKAFKAELQTLKTTLLETSNNLVLNSNFTEAFQDRSSLLLSELGPNSPPTTVTNIMLQTCKKDLDNLLKQLKKRAEGHRVGWERLKGTFLAKNTRESVENLHRQCQVLNNMISIDTAVLGATAYRAIQEGRREHHAARHEQQEAIMEQRKWHESEASQRILTWLTPVEYGPQQSDLLGRRQAGTGEWLLNTHGFQDWFNGHRQTLFCPGMPGTGKTIMTSVVVDYLSTKYGHAVDIGIAYVYCNFRRTHEQKPANILASFLKQLFLRLPNIPDSVTRLYNYHKDRGTRPSLDEICKELHAVTKTATNIFATSRFLPEITNDFVGKSISLEICASGEDTRKFLDGQMKRLPSFVLRNVNLQEEIKTEIVNAAQGMFLLVQLNVDSLVGSKSTKALKKALKELSKGLDHAYNEAMNRIQGQIANSRELAKQVLSWITCAKRPLTTLELQHALAVEIGESELDQENLPEIQDMVSVCAGLVTIDEESNIIRLVHYTLQDFFQRNLNEWVPDAEMNIANICITYLSFDVFGSGSCQSDKKFETRLQENPLYDYSARHWGTHIHAAGSQIPNMSLFRCESKVSACSQAMTVSTEHRYEGYCRNVSRGTTAVHLAAYFGLTETIRFMLENGFNPDTKENFGRTPLSWVAEYGHEAVVKLLVERNDVESDSKDKYGRTPLVWAAIKGHEAIVKLLVERDDVEADSKDRSGRTPLSRAAENGFEAVVKLLLERDDVEADSKDNSGRTPLSRAAENGSEVVVKLLLERDDVEADSKNEVGRTPLLYAVARERSLHWGKDQNQEAVVEMLLKMDCVDVNVKEIGGQTPLIMAFRRGNYTEVKSFLEKDGIDLNCKDIDGRTLLSWAAAQGNNAVMTLLLAKDGVDLNSQDRYGHTPLLFAAGNGHATAVSSLLAEDTTNFESIDNFGRTPLTWAAQKGHTGVVELLREKYKGRGIIISDKDLDIAISSPTDEECRVCCDICLAMIPNFETYYHCGICNRGNFDLCQECVAFGACCYVKTHAMSKRMVENDDSGSFRINENHDKPGAVVEGSRAMEESRGANCESDQDIEAALTRYQRLQLNSTNLHSAADKPTSILMESDKIKS